MSDHVELRWVRAGIAGGLCASILYPLILFAPLPLDLTALAAALLGPAIGIGSLGLNQLVRIHARSVAAALGAIHNVIAGCLFTAMALVQLAVRQATPAAGDELVGVWLGLDVAWDVYIGLGTIFFAAAMIDHPRFRWWFATPGFALGLLVIGLNIATFPTPPAEAGSIDIGPLVGLWYLAATVQAWRSLGWARTMLAPSPR